MLRTGRPEAGRITLLAPDVVLHPDADADSGNIPASAAGAAGADTPLWKAGARILSHWRGGRIDIEGGTLRWPATAASPPLALGLRHVTLRRLGAQWSADALLQLPESLGAAAHLTLLMQGDPAQSASTSGTLHLQAQRLESALWRAAFADPASRDFLPQAGSADLDLQVQFAAGRLVASDGKVNAAALEWAPRAAGAAPLALPRLRAVWQLATRAGVWHLSVSALELDQSPMRASLALDAPADMRSVTGTMQRAPLALLAGIARWREPQLPFRDLDLRGIVTALSFDWSAQRAAGKRLTATAQLDTLSLATAGGTTLAGLGGQVSVSDASFSADLAAEDAQLTLARAEPVRLAGLKVAAHVIAAATADGWQLKSDDVQIQHQDASLAAAVTISARAHDAPPGIDARATLRQADVALLTQLLGPAAAGLFGASGPRLTAGRVAEAQFALRGRLDAALPWSDGSVFHGALELRDASFAAGDLWPEVHGLNAHLDWRGPRIHAALEAGAAGTWQLSAAKLDWDALGAGSAHLKGRLAGATQEALGWLRERPQLYASAPAIGSLDLAGDAQLDVDVTIPGKGAPLAHPRVRLTALLDGVRLTPLAGLPALQGLRGTLAFSDAHLRRSTLSGQWLGGPVTLNVAERRDRGATGLLISGRGLMNAREALLAAGGSLEAAPLQGNAEWSASLDISAVPDPRRARWRIRAESTLVGVSSRLPEPFAKTQSTAFPLRIDAQGNASNGRLRVSLGERLRGVLAVTRGGDSWRIERGALRLAASVPPLPQRQVLLVEGSIGRLDLPAYLRLWRQAGSDAALPAVQARFTSGQLLIGTHSYADVTVTAAAGRGSGQVQIESAELSGLVRWPAPTRRCRGAFHGTQRRPAHRRRARRRRRGRPGCGRRGLGRRAAVAGASARPLCGARQPDRRAPRDAGPGAHRPERANPRQCPLSGRRLRGEILPGQHRRRGDPQPVRAAPGLKRQARPAERRCALAAGERGHPCTPERSTPYAAGGRRNPSRGRHGGRGGVCAARRAGARQGSWHCHARQATAGPAFREPECRLLAARRTGGNFRSALRWGRGDSHARAGWAHRPQL